jgi:hypothetical protein
MLDNSYLQQCDFEFRDLLISLYYKMRKNTVVKDNLAQLFHEVLPHSGFSGACIFMLEPGSDMMHPVLKVGELEPGVLQSFRVMRDSLIQNPIASAFASTIPYRYYVDLPKDEVKTCIVGALGTSEDIGVLYLETVETDESQLRTDSMISFKAARHCLLASLGLIEL